MAMAKRLLLFACLAAAASALRAPKDKPNIIMLFVDDLGYGPMTTTPPLVRFLGQCVHYCLPCRGRRPCSISLLLKPLLESWKL